LIAVVLVPDIKTIIHFKISEEKYTDFINSFDFLEFVCPICEAAVRYHATYTKFLYEIILVIHRVICCSPSCRKTHAIIPSFSVPGCSIGSEELESFIKARNEGKTVDQAGQCFINAGMSADYPESVHKKLKRYQSRIKFIFQTSSIAATSLDYSSLIIHLAGDVEPSVKLGALCRERGFNPVLFSRKNILIFPKIRPGEDNSHNRTFSGPP
jgi:hypothetical protein